ncbi:MAG: hypothetical protein EAZ89_04680, partial [Bacteroidetes bacterium]
MYMKRVFYLLFLLLPLSGLYAQYDTEFQPEYFFGWLPSPRAEAMGQADVAAGNSIASIYYNPAAIGQVKGLQTFVSTAAPLYLLTEADFYDVGFAMKVHPLLTAGLSVRQMSLGETDFEILLGGQYYPIGRSKSTNYALTLASEPVKNLRVGVNVNLFDWKYISKDVSPKTNAYLPHFDAGVMYTLDVPAGSGDPHHLTLAASVTNLSGARITFGVDSFETQQQFPAFARIGAAYAFSREVSIPGMKPGPVDVLLQAEYQNILNSEYKTAFRAGAEVVLLDLLALRIGAYTQNENTTNSTNSYPRHQDFTFGGGLIFPLKELTNGKIPAKARLDVTIMEQAPYVDGRRLPNFRSFGLTMDWDLVL